MLYKKEFFRLNLTCTFVAVLLSSATTQVLADINDDFDTDLLFNVNKSSLGVYIEDSSKLQEGYYDVYVNSDYVFSEELYIEHEQPCISELALSKINIVDSLRNKIEKSASRGKGGCYVIPNEIIKANLDSNSLRLQFFIPQSELDRRSRNYVDPSEYSFGENGLYVNYSANKYLVKGDSGYDTNDHLSIDSSLNVNGWYLRHLGYYSGEEYVSNQTYLTRVIPELESAVKVGRFSTSGRLFSMLSMEGLALEKRTEMLPPSQQGFAPTIRGTATTTAVVIIEQNDLEIYRETVPPGDFVISDLYPLGFGSDLMVTIKESDGTEKKFRVVYNPTSRMLRPGQINQNVYFGRTNISPDDISFMEYDGEFGFNNFVTLYGGFQAASNYNSQLVGISFGTFLGGISVDVRNSNSHFERWINGQSYNLNWAKHIDISNSDITFSAFKYSTEDYYNLGEYVQDSGFIRTSAGRTKGSLAVSLNQSLGEEAGSFYANVSQRNFWGVDSVERQYQLGYSNTWGRANYSVSLNRTGRDNSEYDTSFLFSLNFPLTIGGNDRSAPTVTLSYQDSDAQRSERVGINGVYGEQSEISYGISAQNSNTTSNPAVNGYVSYNNPHANMNLTYARSDSQDAYSFGLKGAVVAWKEGVAFTSQQSDTYAIAHIDNVPDAIINDNYNQVTDSYGNAVIAGVYPYRRNRVIINDRFVDDNVSILNGSKSLIPVRGSISLLNFDSEYKYNVILDIDAKSFIDFSTPIYDDHGNIVGYIGQNNKALVNLDAPKGIMTIGDDICKFGYEVHPDTKRISVNCK